MSSKRSASFNSRSPKFCSENQLQLSRLLTSTCSKSSLSMSKSPLEPISFSQENIQGSSALLASELDRLIVVNSELTREVTGWKRKYKECFKALGQHLPTEMDNENTEKYKQKYTKLKSKALELKKGYKVLENAVTEKNQEIGAWRDKYVKMEQEYIDQIQHLRNQIEVVLKSHIEKEVTIAMTQLEKENSLREENWNAMLARVKDNQNELKMYKEDSEEKVAHISELEKEVKFLNKEHEKTLKQLSNVKEQLSAKEINCQSIQGQCTTLNAELEKIRIAAKEYNREVESVKAEKDNVAKELEETRELLKAVEVKYRDAQCKYILQSGEKLQVNKLQEELGSAYKERDIVVRQLEEVKAALVVSQEKSNRVSALEGELNALNGEKQRVLGQLEDSRKELSALRESYTVLSSQVELGKDTNKKLDELKEENLNLVEQKDKAVKQYDQTKGMLIAVEKNYKAIYSNNVDLKSQIQGLEAVIKEKTTILSQLEEALGAKTSEAYAKEIELASQKEEIALLREKIQSMSAEVEVFRNSQVSSEGRNLEYIEELRKRDQVIRVMEGTIQAEMGQKAELEKNINELKMKVSKGEQENEEYQREKKQMIEQYEKKFSALVDRNTSLVIKERELNMKIEELVIKLREKTELENKITTLTQENATLKTSVTEAQKVQSGLENKLKVLEANWTQLKSIVEGEQEIEGMLRRIDEYKRQGQRLGCELDAWKKRYEDLELRDIQELGRVKSEAESAWRKRIEAEIESKSQVIRSKDEEIVKEKSEKEKVVKSLEARIHALNGKVEESETGRRALVRMNEKLNSQLNQLVKETEDAKMRLEEDKERDIRLASTKLELEKERRAQQEKEFSVLDAQLKEKLTISEEQAKNWKAKVEDFELRQVMYFIEIERLYAINGELIEEVNRVTQELRDASVEIDKNKQMILEVTKAETFRDDQKEQFDEVAVDLKKQIEGFEKKLQVYFNEKHHDEKPQFSKSQPLKMEDLAVETPVKKIEGLKEKKINQDQLSSLQKSHAELRDLALKFEVEKKTMEAQLTQFKRLVDLNKTEMRRYNEDNCESEGRNSRTSNFRLERSNRKDTMSEQPRQSCYGNQDMKARTALKPVSVLHFPLQFTSAGKENTQDISPLLQKSTSSGSFMMFKSPQGHGQRDEEHVLTPRVTLFK